MSEVPRSYPSAMLFAGDVGPGKHASAAEPRQPERALFAGHADLRGYAGNVAFAPRGDGLYVTMPNLDAAAELA